MSKIKSLETVSFGEIMRAMFEIVDGGKTEWVLYVNPKYYKLATMHLNATDDYSPRYRVHIEVRDDVNVGILKRIK